MMNLKTTIIFIIILFSYSTVLFAETKITDASISTTVLGGTGDNLPFWFTSNQLGKYSQTGDFQSLVEGIIKGETTFNDNHLTLDYGTDVVFLVSEDETEPRIIEAYAGLSGKLAVLKAGAFADEEVFGGLSSTNGEILRSLNYQPYPKIRLSTNGFVPFPFLGNWLQFSAEFDEGILSDKRVISDTHIHHKSLMLRLLTSKSTRLTVGINHFVLWGGHSDRYGDLPDGWSDYWRYITASKGSSNFLETDQKNVAGDQIGSHSFSFVKGFEKIVAELRINHPFEDGTGKHYVNYKDNQYILFIGKNKKGSLIDEFIIEYLYSKHQSGDRHQLTGPNAMGGRDNYFNNGVYRSGFSYYGYSLGTPFFYPILENEDGTIVGFANNRIEAWHTGMKGFFSDRVEWKLLLSYSENFGTYAQPYDPIKYQVYSLCELAWKCNKHPMTISALLAVDSGDLVKDQVGCGINIKWDLSGSVIR